MDAKFISDVIPNPHPEFVASLSTFHPPADVLPAFKQFLPELHRLFLMKREAFERGSWEAWNEILNKEAELVARAAGSE